MNDFERDNLWQQRERDRVLVPHFYERHAMRGRYVFLDKGRLATILQKRYACDTVLQAANGKAVFIEEKLVRWPRNNRPYTAICLETNSCTKPGFESDGWMRYGQADILLYGMQLADERFFLRLYKFPELQDWFWPREDEFPVYGPLPTLNATKGRLVGVDAIPPEIMLWSGVVGATSAVRNTVDVGCVGQPALMRGRP